MNVELNQKVEDLLKNQVSQRLQIGVQVCAYHWGEKIIDTYAGTMGPNDPRPVKGDSLFCSWSTTKGIAATALHIQADKGLIEYNRPVAYYWPEFGKHGKDKLTVAQALSHQAGIYKTPSLEQRDIFTDWEKSLEYVENAVPAFEPGTKVGYHAVTFGWIVGGIIQHATGRHIQDVFREDIAEPLGLENEMYVGIPEGVEDRLTTLEVWDPAEIGIPEGHPFLDAMPPELWNNVNEDWFRKACLPAANGHFTANALAKIYGALANGGEIEGVRLVSEERIAAMCSLMTDTLDVVAGASPRRSMGYRLGGEAGSVYGSCLTAFGHGGAGGSYGIADPDSGLSIGVTLNQMMIEMEPAEERAAKISQLIRRELNIENNNR